jgi:hypothetical protein
MDSMLKMLPLIVRLSDDQELREQAAFTAWNAVSGTQLSGVCKPFRLYQKNLIVATLDKTWKKELERIASSMLFKLDSLLGAPLVTFIEFRVDPRYVQRAQHATPGRYRFRRTKELEKELKPLADQIGSESLRRSFLNAAARCIERSESRADADNSN